MYAPRLLSLTARSFPDSIARMIVRRSRPQRVATCWMEYIRGFVAVALAISGKPSANIVTFLYNLSTSCAILIPMKDLFSRQVSLMTLAGVEDVRLDGDSVVGRWKPELGYIVSSKPKKRSFVEDFVNVNSEDPQEILRFTLKYGPLVKPGYEFHPGWIPEPGAEFRQSIKDWKDYQGWMRERYWPISQSLGYKIGMHGGEQVHFDSKGRVCAIVLDSLKRLLEFEIFSTPDALLRVCARPGCGTCFIATRKDSRLCGTPRCADEVRKQFMRDWWKREGKQWRERRKTETKIKKRRKA